MVLKYVGSVFKSHMASESELGSLTLCASAHTLVTATVRIWKYTVAEFRSTTITQKEPAPVSLYFITFVIPVCFPPSLCLYRLVYIPIRLSRVSLEDNFLKRDN